MVDFALERLTCHRLHSNGSFMTLSRSLWAFQRLVAIEGPLSKSDRAFSFSAHALAERLYLSYCRFKDQVQTICRMEGDRSKAIDHNLRTYRQHFREVLWKTIHWKTIHNFYNALIGKRSGML